MQSLKPNLPLGPKFETEVWSQTKLNLSNMVSNQMTGLHLDRH